MAIDLFPLARRLFLAAGIMVALFGLTSCQHAEPKPLPVVVEVLPHVEMSFALTPPLKSSDEAEAKQQALYGALLAESAYAQAQLRIVMQEKSATITADAPSAAAARAQLTAATRALAHIMGQGHFRAPDAASVFRPVTPALRQQVGDILCKRLTGADYRRVSVKIDNAGKLIFSSTTEQVDPDELNMLFMPVRLEFLLLPKSINVDQDHTTSKVTITRNGQIIPDSEAVHSGYLVADGSALKPNCEVTFDNAHQPAVSFAMATRADQERFATATRENIGRQLAIVLDNKIITAPVIRDRIDGNGIISGGFKSVDEAKDLANILNAGTLPCPMQVERTARAE